ncbi:MAG: DUF4349 domain-containing protein [Oscillospiraceae bacterium]
MKRTISAVLALITLLALFSGCASSYKAESAAGAAARPAEAPAPDAPENYEMGGGLNYSAYDKAEDSVAEVKEEEGSTDTDGRIGQKLIYTLNIYLETLDYDASVKSVAELTEKFGGYVQYSSVSQNRVSSSSLRSATYTLRIPAKSLDEFENSCGSIGNVYDSSRSTENATSKYIDLTARLDTYRIEEKTLQDLLSKAEDMESIIALTQRLSEVRYEIESIESTLRNIDSLVSYSTVNLYLYEVVKETKVTSDVPRTFGERVSAAFAAQKDRFIESVKDIGVYLFGVFPLALLLFIIRIIPLIVVVVIAILVFFLVRKRNRAKKRAQGIEVPLTRRELRKAEKARKNAPGKKQDDGFNKPQE